MNRTYFNNYYKFYKEVINYAISNKIDIINTHGNVISSLAWNIRQFKITGKICKLLSNTCSTLNHNDIQSLQPNIDMWCDHMRCWDGGASFFTCKHGIYHLLDNLSWTYADDNRLISTDYFSLPCPFVNYWNGDYAYISNSYKRCKCGRAYRQFCMLKTRSTVTPILNNSLNIQRKINDHKDGIIRIDSVGSFIRIFTKYLFPKERQTEISKLLTGLEVKFTVETDNGQ